MDGRPAERRPRDRIIADLAAKQYGVVSRAQLLEAGIGPGAINTRLTGHRLHRLHRGVYAVGHMALMPLAREMAAVLACGEGAAISHRSAAVLWHLLEPSAAAIDVTVRRQSSRSRPGLVIHRTRRLAPDEIKHLRGLPLTAVPRTLVDLAESASDRELESAYGQALVRRLASPERVRAALARHAYRRGAARLRALVEGGEGPAITRSEAEERFLALVRAAELPPPEVNVRVNDHEVDFLWRDEGLVVEIDGFRFHSSREAFERDRRRDARLQAAGVRVMRVTWRQAADDTYATLARLVQALAAGRPSNAA